MSKSLMIPVVVWWQCLVPTILVCCFHRYGLYTDTTERPTYTTLTDCFIIKTCFLSMLVLCLEHTVFERTWSILQPQMLRLLSSLSARLKSLFLIVFDFKMQAIIYSFLFSFFLILGVCLNMVLVMDSLFCFSMS